MMTCSYCADRFMNRPSMRQMYDLVTHVDNVYPDQWALAGQDILTVPLEYLDASLQWDYAERGISFLQTNGALLTAEHLALFERYNTQVSVCIDGPETLNDRRWRESNTAQPATKKALEHLDWLLTISKAEGKDSLRPSVIATLSATNVSPDRLPIFLAWLKTLHDQGVQYLHFHLLPSHQSGLSDEQLIAALLEIWKISGTLPYMRMINLLAIVTSLRTLRCDPYGLPPALLESRLTTLRATPQEEGGCAECAYWVACQGRCAGSSHELDCLPKTRSSFCTIWKSLWAEGERKIVAVSDKPLTRSRHTAAYEQDLLKLVREGSVVPSTAPMPPIPSSGEDIVPHGDHYDTSLQYRPHGDAHGDHVDMHVTIIPHGDEHGDHMDLAKRGE